MMKFIKSEVFVILLVSVLVIGMFGLILSYSDHRHEVYVSGHEGVVSEVEEPAEEDDSIDEYATWWYYQNFVLW